MLPEVFACSIQPDLLLHIKNSLLQDPVSTLAITSFCSVLIFCIDERGEKYIYEQMTYHLARILKRRQNKNRRRIFPCFIESNGFIIAVALDRDVEFSCTIIHNNSILHFQPATF